MLAAVCCRVAAKLGHSILAWRRVPTNNYNLGDSAKSTEPSVEQCFLSMSSAPQTTSPDPEAQVQATSEAACCATLYLARNIPAASYVTPPVQALRWLTGVQFYILRKLVEHEWNRKGYDHKHAYICSLSAHTIVYKGQLMPQQVRACI